MIPPTEVAEHGFLADYMKFFLDIKERSPKIGNQLVQVPSSSHPRGRPSLHPKPEKP